MKIGDYITAESWNSLTVHEQIIFINGLRFLGNDLGECWLPKHRVNHDLALISPRLLLSCYTGELEDDDEFTIKEIRAFINLMSFEDDHEKV